MLFFSGARLKERLNVWSEVKSFLINDFYFSLLTLVITES